MPDAPLSGFSSQSGANKDGINLWSDVFLYDNEVTGEKFAIILIDTEGFFKRKTPQEANRKIFSFLNLMSSVQIFNLPNIAEENHLEYLQFATEFAKLSKNGGNPGKSFEELLFLIRDWANVDQYNYGFEGGAGYLMNEILSKNAEQGQSIRDSFDRLSCFLLSHPGKAVQNSDYDGRWSALDKEFVEGLKELVPSLLSPANLKARKFGGVDVTASEYLLNLKSLVKVFSETNAPTAQMVFESRSAN